MRKPVLVLAAAAVLVVASACNDSNDVTSPGAVVNAANVAGDWSGEYASHSPTLCSNLSATAKLSQQGDRVTGTFEALGCRIKGRFNGTVRGNVLSGSVDMAGCTGGAVTGRIENGSLALTVSDFTKQLITGDAEVMPGGQASLRR